MYAWCRWRAIGPAGAALAGLMWMLSGPVFLRIEAGHLPHLCVLAWVPAVFGCVDAWLRTARTKWIVLGSMCVAMQIFAGHPQYVYFEALAAGIFAIVNWLAAAAHAGDCKSQIQNLQSPTSSLQSSISSLTILGFSAIFLVAALLAAVQILPGIDAAGESWRAGGLDYDFAAQFSLAPESLLTFVAPALFGDMNHTDYVGRWQLWEMCGFVGLSGLVLSVVGIARRTQGPIWVWITFIGLMLILALGRHTPVFGLLHAYLPGFDSFRAPAKFLFPIALMLCMLAGAGFESLLKNPAGNTWKVILGASAAAGCFALLVAFSPIFPGAVGFIRATGETCNSLLRWDDPLFVAGASSQAARSMLLASVILAMSALLLRRARQAPRAVYGIAILCGVELLHFAATHADVMPSRPAAPHLAEARRAAAKNQRVLHVDDMLTNAGMAGGWNDLWGYDPGAAKRYVELLAATQGIAPARATQNIQFTKFPPILALLRCGTVLPFDPKSAAIQIKDPLPRVLVVPNVEISDDPLSRIMQADFDPRRLVVFERTTPADLRGQIAAASISNLQSVIPTTRVLASSTDWLEIEATTPAAAVLLITDTYAKGWRARSLDTQPVQPAYEILPANHALRGIPLAAGSHRIRVEYAPASFRLGAVVSLVALAGWGVAFWLTFRRPWFR